jgi:hypothetical protein
MLRIAALAVACVACANNPGAPRYRGTQPTALPAFAPPVPAEAVRVAMQPLPWWTVADHGTAYVLQLGDPEVSLEGHAIGAVRSSDVDADHEAVRCAFQIVPMGDPRPCAGPREVATDIARPAIDRALAELQAQAGSAGANGVRDVRCFASDRTSGHVWCEGTAIDTTRIAPPQQPGSRFLLVADASVGTFGSQAVVGSTLGVRYRPIELGFYIADLSRSSVAPQQGGLIGLGGTVLGRFGLGGSRADAIAGVTAATVLRNGSTNPDVTALYYGFAGLAYQSTWRISGHAQPFVQLRAGAARSTAEKQTLPMLELHLGLSTPERR